MDHAFRWLTVDQTHRPRAAMTSAGEILGRAQDEAMGALWPPSTSTADLPRTRETTVVAVVGPESYYIRTRAGGQTTSQCNPSKLVIFTYDANKAL